MCINLPCARMGQVGVGRNAQRTPEGLSSCPEESRNLRGRNVLAECLDDRGAHFQISSQVSSESNSNSTHNPWEL